MCTTYIYIYAYPYLNAFSVTIHNNLLGCNYYDTSLHSSNIVVMIAFLIAHSMSCILVTALLEYIAAHLTNALLELLTFDPNSYTFIRIVLQTMRQALYIFANSFPPLLP